ncbi:hypothetical protein F4859DRAFT_417451 [Xylaria cf. heliscus]|nr:hypothetical protein F4859DRAFT_417451 [Xylaria cf. heliscus]
MFKPSEQDISYEGEALRLQVSNENNDSPNPQPVLSFSSSRSSRTQPPHLSLSPPCIATTTQDTDTLEGVKSSGSKSTYLGRFTSKRSETAFDVDISGEEDYEEEDCEEEDCEEEDYEEEDYEEEEYDDGDYEEGDYDEADYDQDDLLEVLDGLEAAWPKPEKRQDLIPGNREAIWDMPDQLRFDSWVDEVAALEASISMPEGTRYYKAKDTI